MVEPMGMSADPAEGTSAVSETAVVDAGVLAATVINTPDSRPVAELWERLQAGRVAVHSPQLWRYELTSVLRRYVFDGLISEAAADRATECALALGIAGVDESPAFHVAALRWADRLGHRAAYDGFYVAAAAQIGAELWTCDRKLARRAGQIGISWVREVGR